MTYNASKVVPFCRASRADAASDDFTRRKFEWLDRVSVDRSVGSFAFRVAYLLSGYFNRTTGAAFPSQTTLAVRLGATVRGVQKALRELVEAGHLVVEEAAGRGRTNQYRPALQNTNHGSSFADKNTNHGSSFTGGNNEPPFRKTRTVVRTEPSEEHLREESRSSDLHKARAKTTAKLGSQNLEAQFFEWWSHYPRKVGRRRAQEIYTYLVSRGEVTPEQLQAGAIRYSAACDGRDQKYIKHPDMAQ
jgi:hypothetical protein